MGPISKEQEENVEWNVQWVKAEAVWRKGFEGQGIVVGNADTGIIIYYYIKGIEFDHPALVSNYRGNKNGTFNHNFNWFDGVRDFPSCGSCPCKGERPVFYSY
jgi:hypothetical protein